MASRRHRQGPRQAGLGTGSAFGLVAMMVDADLERVAHRGENRTMILGLIPSRPSQILDRQSQTHENRRHRHRLRGPGHGTCFADSGNDVTCVDIDRGQDRRLQPGRDSDLRAGPAELVERNAAAGRLHFTTDAGEAVATAGWSSWPSARRRAPTARPT